MVRTLKLLFSIKLFIILIHQASIFNAQDYHIYIAQAKKVLYDTVRYPDRNKRNRVAAEIFKKAVVASGYNGQVWFLYADFTRKYSVWEEAVIGFDEALAKNYFTLYSLNTTVLGYYNISRYSKALEIADFAFSKNIFDYRLLESAGKSALKIKKFQLAKTWFERSLDFLNKHKNYQDRNKYFQLAHGNLAEVYYELNDFSSALNYAKTGLKFYSNAEWSISNFYKIYARCATYLGLIELGNKNYDNALKYFDEALTISKRGNVPHYFAPESQISFLKKITILHKKLGNFQPLYKQKNVVIFIKNVNLPSNIPVFFNIADYKKILNQLEISNDLGGIFSFRITYLYNRKNKRYEIEQSSSYGIRNYLSNLFTKLGYRAETPAQITDRMSREEIDKSLIRLKIVKLILEVYSKGKFSIDFKIVQLDSAYTRVQNVRNGRIPDYNYVLPYPVELMYNFASQFDGIWFMSRGSILSPEGRGGNGSLPIIPYHLFTPRRAIVYCNTNTVDALHDLNYSGFEVQLHEYFHSVEPVWNLPPHLYRFKNLMKKLLPYYNGEGDFKIWYYRPVESREYAYQNYIFSTYIPQMIIKQNQSGDNLGWQHFAFAKKYPFRLSRKTFLYNLNLANQVPLENRKLSWELNKQAMKAWKDNNKELAFTLYQKAFSVNPAFYNYYKWFGYKAELSGNFDLAAELYEKYIKFTDNWAYAYKIAIWYHYKLNKIDKAKEYYKEALEFVIDPLIKIEIEKHYNKLLSQ